jgi:2-isopropylmalate synthase
VIPPDPRLFDWSTPQLRARSFDLTDETLRDGLQSPRAIRPSLEARFELLEKMADIGVARVGLGMPSAGVRAMQDAIALARCIAERRLPLRGHVAARTLDGDLEAAAEVMQRAGVAVDVHVFRATSRLRMELEGSDVQRVRDDLGHAIARAQHLGLRAAAVTEDTTRTHPETLAMVLAAAVDAGAFALVHCDTTGSAEPESVARLIAWTRERFGTIRIEFHGHDDRGLAVANARSAILSGADGVHATALGLGERCGNTSLEVLLANLVLDGLSDVALERLDAYVQTASRTLGIPVPRPHPIFGDDAYRTATGTHGALLARADPRTADRLFSPLPAQALGRTQQIALGPNSGVGCARAVLAQRGVAEPSAVLLDALLARAKAADRLLTDPEIAEIASAHASG